MSYPRLFLVSLLLGACAPQPIGSTPTPGITSSPPLPSSTPAPDTSMPKPTPFPTAVSSPVPEPSNILPTVDPNLDISIQEPTTFNGRIFDDNNSLLNEVSVKVRSLSTDTPFEAEVTTVNGTYVINNAPAGIQLEITASKPGYTTRRRVEVLKSNKQGDPNLNRYDFGTDLDPNTTGNFLNALSNLPEVVKVSPGRNAKAVAPNTSIVLTFSEPMDMQSVENAFAIRAFNEQRLSVDSANPGFTLNGNAQIGIWNGTPADAVIKNANVGTPIWNKDALSISWNAEQTEATFQLTAERTLPTDHASNRVPDYRISFGGWTGNHISDQDGNSRNHHHFRVHDGSFEDSYHFSVLPDHQTPSIAGLSARTQGNATGDALQVRFNKRMLLDTHEIAIAGGMDGLSGSARRAAAAYPQGSGEATDAHWVAQNYHLNILLNGDSNAVKYTGTWADLGGQALFDSSDASYKTVVLRAPLASPISFAAMNTGDTLNVDIRFADGSTDNAILTAANDITGTFELQTAFNDNASWGNDKWQTRLEPASGNAPPDPDVFRLSGSLNNAQITLDREVYFQKDSNALKRVAAITLNGQERLVGANVSSSGHWNYFQAGDQIQMTVANTIVDPAGNSLSSNQISGNAN